MGGTGIRNLSQEAPAADDEPIIEEVREAKQETKP